jgi:mono/diheme cytochrome c family protein
MAGLVTASRVYPTCCAHGCGGTRAGPSSDAIHVLARSKDSEDVDARHKAGHDEASSVTAAALVLAVGLLFATSARAADPTPEQIDLGRMVYDDFCATCHGRDMVNPGLVSFDLRKFPKDDLDRFRNSVLNGKGQAMPPWRDKVSDEDLTVLWAYVRSGGT